MEIAFPWFMVFPTFPLLINGLCLQNDSSVLIKDHKGNKHTWDLFLTLLSLCLNVTHLNSTARDPQRRLIQEVEKGSQITKWHLETTFICVSRVLQVGPNVNKNIFWWWKPLQNQCFVIKMGTRINCAIFFLCVCFDSKAIVIQIQFQNHYFCWKNTKYEKRGHSLSFWSSAEFIQQNDELTLEMFLFTCPPRKLSSRNHCRRGCVVFTNFLMQYLGSQ